MRRSFFLAAALIAVAISAGCSKHDDSGVGSDVRDAGHSIDQAASKAARDPDVKRAEAGLKDAGHDAAKDLRKAAEEAKVAAHQLAADTSNVAHDVSKSDHDDRDHERDQDR